MSKCSSIIIEDSTTGKIRITTKGIELLGQQFGEVGIDIRKITTREEARHALDLVFAKKVRKLAQSDTGKGPAIKELFKGMPDWGEPGNP